MPCQPACHPDSQNLEFYPYFTGRKDSIVYGGHALAALPKSHGKFVAVGK